MRYILLFVLLTVPSMAHATNYYISPTGSNSNNGLTTGAPFLTFAYAINSARAWCGDTLFLLDGTYGDGTSTGLLDVNGATCTIGNELTIMSVNERQPKIQSTNGASIPCRIRSSAWIVLHSVYCRGPGDNASAGSSGASPVEVRSSNNVILRGNVFVGPNRFTNSHGSGTFFSTDVLLEDNEVYIFARHCFTAWQSERVVVRRLYCNPRDGMPSGGVGPGVGLADAAVSMYPCKDCIQENTISDGTTASMYMNEMNATFGSGVLMSGSEVLGSICLDCRVNGIYIAARSAADANHSPQNILLRDNVFYNHTGQSSAIRASNCMGCTVDHLTMIGGSSADGITFDDTSLGVGGSQQSGEVTSTTISGMDRAYHVAAGSYTGGFSSNALNAFNNTTNFSSGTWTNTNTNDPGWGTCRGAWVPDASPLKGAGVGGSDQGATILYRYVDGVLTTTPLWDPTTAAFPYGAATADGVNRVAGNSLNDFHTRMNINTGGCPFPTGFTDPGGGGGGGGEPTDPSGIVSSTNLTGPHVHVVSSAADRGLTVAVTVIWDGFGVPVYATSLTSSCGSENIPAISPAALYTGTSAGHRSLRIFGLVNPTSGTCTLTPTFSGTISGGWVMTSAEESNIGSYGVVATNIGSSVTPTVTSNTNPDELTRTFVGTGTGATITLSAGPDQTLTTDHQHSSVSLRIGSSTQSGADGQEESFILGGLRAWAIAAVPIVPPSPGGPTGSTFTIPAYRTEGLHGYPGNSEISLGPLCPDNTPARIAPGGAFRVRFKLLVENEPSVATGVALYCKENAGPYFRVQDAFNGHHLAYYGPGANETIPSTGTSTSQRFGGTGTFIPTGRVVRTDSLPIVLGSIAVNNYVEMDYLLTSGNGVTRNTTFQCLMLRDSGEDLGIYTVDLPLIIVQDPQSSAGH